MIVQSGLDRLTADDFEPIRGRRVGLLTHDAAVDRNFRSASHWFRTTDRLRLLALFSPEHGARGQAQDLEAVPADHQTSNGVRHFSLYGSTVESLRPTADMLSDLDDLVVDLVDVGARYYTFQATMLYCMEAAAAHGIRVMVLDRPNPIAGDRVEGPLLTPGFESFVGPHPICTRHGMTLGELARLYVAERHLDVELLVIPCRGWRRELSADATGLPWVMPSPNMPTLDTAVVYPGMCLIEGTNLSEGRGTTRPFELVGFPGVDSQAIAHHLNNQALPGAHFRPAAFKPTSQKHASRMCDGVQIHVTDRSRVLPVRTGAAVLTEFRRAAGRDFAWRTDPYEFVAEPIAIDLLFGSSRERTAIEAGADWRDLAVRWATDERTFSEQRQPFLLY